MNNTENLEKRVKTLNNSKSVLIKKSTSNPKKISLNNNNNNSNYNFNNNNNNITPSNSNNNTPSNSNSNNTYNTKTEELLNILNNNKELLKLIKHNNLYLNVKLNNNNNQEYLKSLQNYVKTQRLVLKIVNDNIKESKEIMKKYKTTGDLMKTFKFTGKLFMKKENNEKLKKLLTEENKKKIESNVTNAVKEIKKTVNKSTKVNKRQKFKDLLKNYNADERLRELKKEKKNELHLNNIKPIGRLGI